jgi:hypothetical protein
MYEIEAPVSVGGTLLLGIASNGFSPTVHKAWFMDNLHEGDKVLFSPVCKKHNRCTIRLPNPDKPNKEILTLGFFFPAIAKTNTTVLCGTGKLTADVEAQVCRPENTPPTPAALSPIPPAEQTPTSAEGSYESVGLTESMTPSPGNLAALGLVIEDDSGLDFPMITEVVYRGAGYRGGLQVGFLIVGVNGETTHSVQEVNEAIAALPPRTKTITVGYNFPSNLGYMPNQVSVWLDSK